MKVIHIPETRLLKKKIKPYPDTITLSLSRVRELVAAEKYLESLKKNLKRTPWLTALFALITLVSGILSGVAAEKLFNF